MSAAVSALARPSTTLSSPGAGLLHPAVIVAIAVVAINDHVLKALVPGFVTGKLSDVAGLFFFPFFLQASSEWMAVALGRYRAPSLRVLIVAAAATAVFFAAMKLTSTGAELYRWLWSMLQWAPRSLIALATHQPLPSRGAVGLTMDATDLICLPAVVAAVVIGASRSNAPRTRKTMPLETM